MQTISECVNRIITRKPFVAEALQKGLINISSLARNIIPEIEEQLKKKVQPGAVVMALQRYSQEKEIVISNKLKSCLNNISDVFVRSGLSEFTYKNSDDLFNRYVSFVKKISLGNDVFFTFVHGVFETNYVISNSLSKIFRDAFKNESQVAYETELSSITVRLPKINVQTQGLYYYILQGIAWEGINIINMISTSNEFTIIVKDADVEKAFSVIKNLKEKKPGK
ncbi:MAG TPA: aspartate kinase [Bacteroidales bacterium]|nr:aspartate kinase [Bacteroidales bacterium]HPS17163.1 aspartate kinase [Bacteroidales bacterium]